MNMYNYYSLMLEDKTQSIPTVKYNLKHRRRRNHNINHLFSNSLFYRNVISETHKQTKLTKHQQLTNILYLH